MPLPANLVGRTTDPIRHHVDARWTMAFAAGVGDTSPPYLDTRRDDLVAHPLFPVALEWPAVLALRELDDDARLTPDEVRRGVHASHDLVVHRLVAPAEVLVTTATVATVEARTSGAYQVIRLETVDEQGDPVATTLMGSLFLGVEVVGEDASTLPEPPRRMADAVADAVIVEEIDHHVSSASAHTYTACSRIFNPIHTDVAVAQAAGLPGPILHGTATLAMALSDVVRSRAGEDPRRVREVSCRFAAMVEIPSRMSVLLGEEVPAQGDPLLTLVPFEVMNAQGEPAIRAGLVVLGPP